MTWRSSAVLASLLTAAHVAWRVFTVGTSVMNILGFFKGIGKVLQRAFGLVKQLVPEAQLVQAIELVRVAGDKFVENQLRREWVLQELMGVFHLPESVARLILEIAVQHVKHDVVDKGAAKLEDAAKQP